MEKKCYLACEKIYSLTPSLCRFLQRVFSRQPSSMFERIESHSLSDLFFRTSLHHLCRHMSHITSMSKFWISDVNVLCIFQKIQSFALPSTSENWGKRIFRSFEPDLKFHTKIKFTEFNANTKILFSITPCIWVLNVFK